LKPANEQTLRVVWSKTLTAIDRDQAEGKNSERHFLNRLKRVTTIVIAQRKATTVFRSPEIQACRKS
jgi:hypothetical protein